MLSSEVNDTLELMDIDLGGDKISLALHAGIHAPFYRPVQAVKTARSLCDEIVDVRCDAVNAEDELHLSQASTIANQILRQTLLYACGY
jgi:hypothetical protein